MTILTWLGGALTLALLVYLLVVMLKPGLFS
jgi:K+-transporting ATPase KdpF subunit